MRHQMEEAPGIIQDKSYLNKVARRIVFIKMLCNPIFLLVYFFFCRTMYWFCVYGGVRKRGTILAVCALVFVAYLILYFVVTRGIRVSESIPENEAAVKNYGFYRDYFYAFGADKVLYVKECDEKEKDFLRLKYSKLPRYKDFFWKLPAIAILVIVTIITIIGVIKSAIPFNGKLAWFLFDLYHTPIVAEKEDISKDDTSQDDIENVIPIEIFSEKNAATEEVLDKEKYGFSTLVEKHYENDDGLTEYFYNVEQYYFDGERFRLVNDTLQGIYEEKESEFFSYYRPGKMVVEDTSDNSVGVSYDTKSFYLEEIKYLDNDYVSLLFISVSEWPNMPHPTYIFSPLTIEISTGEVSGIEKILGKSWETIADELEIGYQLMEDYDFYLQGDQVHFIYKFNNIYDKDEIVINRYED